MDPAGPLQTTTLALEQAVSRFAVLIDTLRGEGGGILSVAIPLIMGWRIVLAFDAIIAAMPPAGLPAAAGRRPSSTPSA
jgi:predicted membrane channel-forming protein YqfA (hemolysin III family)